MGEPSACTIAGVASARATASWQAPDDRIMLKAATTMKMIPPKNSATALQQPSTTIRTQLRLHQVPPIWPMGGDTGEGSFVSAFCSVHEFIGSSCR
jgi:hypothetical protein